MSKDSRYSDRERDRSPHFRGVRDDGHRRSIPDHKADMRSSRDHRYSEPTKGKEKFYNFTHLTNKFILCSLKILVDLIAAEVVDGDTLVHLARSLILAPIHHPNHGLKTPGGPAMSLVVDLIGKI